MAMKLVRGLIPKFGSANALATFSRRFCAQSDSQVYIVQLSLERELGPEELEQWYHRVMSGGKKSGIGSDKDPRIVSTYKIVLNGFAARLTRDEVLALSKHDDFLVASPSKTNRFDHPGYMPPPSQRVPITWEYLEKLSSEEKEKLFEDVGEVDRDSFMKRGRADSIYKDGYYS